MTEQPDTTTAYRLGRVEKAVEEKANVGDVIRLEQAVEKLTASVQRLVYLGFAATTTASTAIVLLAIEISAR